MRHLPVYGIGASLADLLTRNGDPFFGQLNHRLRIHQTVAERMADFLADTVHSPVAGLQIARIRCLHNQMLHVSPGESRTAVRKGGKERIGGAIEEESLIGKLVK